MAELADALDLGSSGRPCRFDSCYPHIISRFTYLGVSGYYILGFCDSLMLRSIGFMLVWDGVEYERFYD